MGIFKQKGLFIVLEGIDCCGKTTQAQLLQQFLQSLQYPSAISPEPTDGIIGRLIRQELSEPQINAKNSANYDRQLAYLFACDRNNHLFNEDDGILALNEKGITTIVPRYYFSSIAYNQKTTEEAELVIRLNLSFPPPDLVIYLDIPLIVALQRLDSRGTPNTSREIYEKEGKLREARQNYEKIFSSYGGELLRVDGCQQEQEIANEINQKVLSLFR